MDKADIKTNLFKIGELIDEANQCETDLDLAINLVLQTSKSFDNLNDHQFRADLDNLKKAWNKREQFNELRIKLNTIY